MTSNPVLEKAFYIIVIVAGLIYIVRTHAA